MASLGTLLGAAALGYAVLAWGAVLLWRNSGAQRKRHSMAGLVYRAALCCPGRPGLAASWE